MSALQALKERLKQENGPSETWYSQQKAEQFEHCLKAVESHFSQAQALLLSLSERLSSHCNPID